MDLSPTDLNIDGGLLIKDYLPTKFEASVVVFSSYQLHKVWQTNMTLTFRP